MCLFFCIDGNNLIMKVINKSIVFKFAAVLSVASVIIYLFELFGINTDLSYLLFKSRAVRILSLFPKNLFFFNFINTILITFGVYDYEKLVFFTSLGGAKLINGGIVCGIVNLARYGSDTAAVYLSAKVITLFSLTGICLALSMVDKAHIKEYLFVAVFMLLTGNATPVLLLLLLIKRPVYYLSLLFSFLSCLIAQVAEKAFVFCVSPSVFELFIHSSSKIYLFAMMIFTVAASYYISVLVCAKLK